MHEWYKDEKQKTVTEIFVCSYPKRRLLFNIPNILLSHLYLQQAIGKLLVMTLGTAWKKLNVTLATKEAARNKKAENWKELKYLKNLKSMQKWEFTLNDQHRFPEADWD